jgi:hypothetical protein
VDCDQRSWHQEPKKGPKSMRYATLPAGTSDVLFAYVVSVSMHFALDASRYQTLCMKFDLDTRLAFAPNHRAELPCDRQAGEC